MSVGISKKIVHQNMIDLIKVIAISKDNWWMEKWPRLRLARNGTHFHHKNEIFLFTIRLSRFHERLRGLEYHSQDNTNSHCYVLSCTIYVINLFDQELNRKIGMILPKIGLVIYFHQSWGKVLLQSTNESYKLQESYHLTIPKNAKYHDIGARIYQDTM